MEFAVEPMVAVEIAFLEMTPRLTVQIAASRGRYASRIRKSKKTSEPGAPFFGTQGNHVCVRLFLFFPTC